MEPLKKSLPLQEQIQNQTCDCDVLLEEDILGATLTASPEKTKKFELQTWLACRGLSYKTSSTKALLVNSVKRYMESGLTFSFTDPDPSQSNLRRKKALCKSCKTISPQPSADKPKPKTSLPSHGWTESTASVPQCFTSVDLVTFMRRTGKTIINPVTKENATRSDPVFSRTCLEKGYKFFFDGYIHDVQAVRTDDSAIVRCKCYPSQKKNDPPHKLHVELNGNGEVLVGKCSCIAGQTGCCNHVVGLLYLLDHTLRMKLMTFPQKGTVTDNPQKWHRARTDGVTPEPIMSVTVVKPSIKSGRSKSGVNSSLYEARAISTIGSEQDRGVVAREKLSFRNGSFGFCQVFSTTQCLTDTVLGHAAPIGSILSHQCTINEAHFNVECAINTVPKLEVPLTSKQCEGLVFPPFPLLDLPTCDVNVPKEWLADIKLSTTEATTLELLTRCQAKCDLWHQSRSKRLTSSKFWLIITRKSLKDKLVEQILAAKSISHVQSVKWGIDNEDQAVLQYRRYMDRIKKTVVVESCGNVVNPKYPWMSASPDRRVLDSDFGAGLIEVKCPHKYKDVDPTVPAKEDASFCVYYNDDNKLAVRKSHQYYAQIQGQMGVTGTLWCDLVVWTTKGLLVCRTGFDYEFWEIMQQKLKGFYEEHFVPVSVKSSQTS